MPPTAIVTGAARGIGLAIARRLAGDGFATIATDREVSALADEVAHQASQGRSFSAIAMDVTDRAAVCAVLDRAGEVHVVVNNAGVAAPMIAFKALTQDELRRALMEQARRYPGQEKFVYQYFEKTPGALQELRAPIFEDKVVDFIIAAANPAEKKVSREELVRLVDEVTQS